VIFGLQRTRLEALQKMREDLAALAAARRITKIICLGVNADSRLSEQERQLIVALPLTEGFDQVGGAPEEKISEVLSSCSFGIFAQNELSFEKSGSFMAYAAHQVNILADFADPSKPEPICRLIAPQELLRGLSETELHIRAERLRVWQEKTSSWSIIAEQIGEAMNLKDPV
jgi:hypothetical protein